jgi:hypothetical protein
MRARIISDLDGVKHYTVRVTLTGVRALVWRCTYTFRTSDDRMVSYRGVHGLPGTPETRIDLVEDTILLADGGLHRFRPDDHSIQPEVTTPMVAGSPTISSPAWTPEPSNRI